MRSNKVGWETRGGLTDLCLEKRALQLHSLRLALVGIGFGIPALLQFGRPEATRFGIGEVQVEENAGPSDAFGRTDF